MVLRARVYDRWLAGKACDAVGCQSPSSSALRHFEPCVRSLRGAKHQYNRTNPQNCSLASAKMIAVVARSTAALSRAACTTPALGTWAGRTVNRAACSSSALRRTGCVLRALATKPPENGDAEEQSRPTPTPEPEYGVGPPKGLLRNVGQVIFMDKPAVGSLALLGLAVGEPYLVGLGFAGGTTATVTARAVGLDEAATDDGLMGYNGVLVGCAFSQFLAVSPPVALAATVAGAAATAPLAAVLKPLCGRVPQWTLAFNVATLSALLYTNKKIRAHIIAGIVGTVSP